MKLEVGWNEFLIEKGVRDPLAIWRVGGRMVSELLPPYTTVVTNRPARYFSMYAWAIQRLNWDKSIKEKGAFWRRFFRLEACLLCAIASHGEHQYEGFGGAIGSKASSKLLSNAVGGTIDLSRFTGVANGWQSNYMKPMQDLGLIDIDPGLPSGLRPTAAGTDLAEAYGASIGSTEFYREYVTCDQIPLSVVQDLAQVGCTCLLHSPSTAALRNERECCVKQLLLGPIEGGDEAERADELQGSMHLLVDVLRAADDVGRPLDLLRWRRVLSTGRVDLEAPYQAQPAWDTAFRKWQMYNTDALLVYSLEEGLAGFLEALHAEGAAGLKKDELSSARFTKALDLAIDSKTELRVFATESAEACIDGISCLGPKARHTLEATLVEELRDANGPQRIAGAYLLFLYVEGLFKTLKADPRNGEALDFYRDSAHQDGHELSLLHLASISIENRTLQQDFLEHFLEELVINRQLSTREARGKEQAWFGYVSETDTFEWESEYRPHLYRAARSNIFMSLLLSLGLVRPSDGGSPGWMPDRHALAQAGL